VEFILRPRRFCHRRRVHPSTKIAETQRGPADVPRGARIGVEWSTARGEWVHMESSERVMARVESELFGYYTVGPIEHPVKPCKAYAYGSSICQNSMARLWDQSMDVRSTLPKDFRSL
jgi:hypothetical protein